MIKKFLLDPAALDKWMYQNKAIYTGDYIEGCLLDNFVVGTRRGYAAIYENYINANRSGPEKTKTDIIEAIKSEREYIKTIPTWHLLKIAGEA